MSRRKPDPELLRTAWTIVVDPEEHARALRVAVGEYQTDILLGLHNLSGSTLTGSMRRWSSTYRKKRERLLEALTAAGVKWHEAKGPNNRRVLIIGE